MTELTPERLCRISAQTITEGVCGADVSEVNRLADSWGRDRREIERLRAERDTLQQNWQRCAEYAARVEEENGRLREALEKMEAMPDSAMPKARRIACEALAATEKRDD